jgi:hypothetical protein
MTGGSIMASRLLLPFTFGVDTQAITYAVQLARSQNAVLVPLALVSQKDGKKPRLEHVQQSQDFLSMVRTIATRLQVPVECYECYTSDVIGSITQLSSELACESDIVVMSTRKTWLIQSDETQALLKQAGISLVLLHMPERPQRRGSVLIEHVIKNWRHQEIPQASNLLTSH